MVKIAQISDVHFRPIQRHDEYKKVFENLLKDLLEIKPDIIINTGDFYHLKTSQISPEVIKIMSWAFKELSKIAPTFSILGNHDCNLSNPDRDNIIKIIHGILDDKNLILLDKSKTYILKTNNLKIALHPFSMIDKANWINLKPLEDHINIALYHGSIMGCKTDSEWTMTHTESDINFFKNYDYVFLGDIHKNQTMRTKDIEEIVSEEQYKKYIELYGHENIELIEEIV